MHSLHIRLGRFEFYAQRETAPATFKVTRQIPGEITVDLPGVTVFLTNSHRTSAHFKAIKEAA